jgi:CheY-like chemotaxis protein
MMETRHKILLVDDDPALLELYSELLMQLPSKPEITRANSGARALAMLEAEPYRLMICDLKMPKVDGLQVLSIVRRKHPQLRTVALTSVIDEQFRSRVYALGVDLFWHKPATPQETQMFLECLESLMGQEKEDGFRGIQRKSLVDIIQMECLSQSSSVLRITNGALTGKIWIQDGELIDAETEDLGGETAFHKVLSWKNGSFETLPAEPSRTRRILKPYNGLLLESAQALDEQQAGVTPEGGAPAPVSPLSRLSQIEGVEFVLVLKAGDPNAQEARGLENPECMAAWARQRLDRFRDLGNLLQAGPLEQIAGLGPQRHVTLAVENETELCVGWRHSLTPEVMRELTKKVLALWAC